MNILVLNCGSSSAKFAVLETVDGRELVSGIAQRLGSPEASIDWKIPGEGETRKGTRAIPGADHAAALRAVVEVLRASELADGIAGIGHRVVHGGARFSGSMELNAAVVAMVEECVPLGPLHNPANLTGIAIARELFPGLRQVGVFDTAFHQSMPPRAYLYPVPHAWFTDHQVRRYGFHGTSHRYVSQEAIRLLGLDPADSALVTAHLGNGSSCAAVRDGQSVDTTMGLTPLEGLVMGTRSGSVDPAIIGHVAKTTGMPEAAVLEALNKKSGLLGISGLSNDMRTLAEAAEKGHERAALAIEVFCYVLAKTVAGLVVPLGRLDALIFTGGIGENSAPVRARVIEQLGFLGLTLDPEANARHGRDRGGRVTRSTRPVAAVVPTNEELLIARDTAAIVGA